MGLNVQAARTGFQPGRAKEAPAPGWAYGKVRGEYWKYKNEKPLFSIDATNVDKYKDKLSPGQVQLVKQTKGYRMDVYPSHRNADFPDFVQANTKKNARDVPSSALMGCT